MNSEDYFLFTMILVIMISKHLCWYDVGNYIYDGNEKDNDENNENAAREKKVKTLLLSQSSFRSHLYIFFFHQPQGKRYDI